MQPGANLKLAMLLPPRHVPSHQADYMPES